MDDVGRREVEFDEEAATRRGGTFAVLCGGALVPLVERAGFVEPEVKVGAAGFVRGGRVRMLLVKLLLRAESFLGSSCSMRSSSSSFRFGRRDMAEERWLNQARRSRGHDHPLILNSTKMLYSKCQESYQCDNCEHSLAWGFKSTTRSRADNPWDYPVHKT